MKKIIIISFLLQVVFSGYIYSQFTGYYGKINKKPAYHCPNPVVSLGDQNDDGYDDFMICEWKGRLETGDYDTLYTFYFYKGGKSWILYLTILFHFHIRLPMDHTA